MARRRRKLKKPVEEYTFLAIGVEGFDADSEVSMNPDLWLDRPLFANEDDLAFQFVTTLELKGACTYPPECAGETYEILIQGDEKHAGKFAPTVGDYWVRDDCGVRQYRTCRGVDYPIYERPKGIAPLKRRRATKIWDAWVRVAPSLVSDMLTILSLQRPTYLAINERKIGRARWIHSLGLQTRDPSEE